MQAGFAVVEAVAGRRTPTTMMMNFITAWHAGISSSFPLQMARGAIANLGGTLRPTRVRDSSVREGHRLFGQTGYLLMHRGTYDAVW
jgi:hypothetical protein